MAFRVNIEKATLRNKNYRKVIHTTNHIQLVLMTLKRGEEIGMERHSNLAQFIRVEAGSAKAIVARNVYRLKDGDAIIIPARTMHNIINTGNTDLKLYTVYTSPIHEDNCVQKNKDSVEC